MMLSYNGIELDVNFSYYPPSRGHRDKWGAPEEPDEDASIEISNIIYEGKDVTDLCDAAGILDDIETLVWSWMDSEADYEGCHDER